MTADVQHAAVAPERRCFASYDQHVASKDFPDLTQAYRSLGITARGTGIELAPEGRDKQLRDAIMETGVLVISEVPDP